MRSTSSWRSSVMICETLTTDGFERPESDLPSRTFPGASASAKFEVTMATITVAMRLSLNGFDWTTTTGRLNPGPEPVGSGSEAHQSSPRFIAKVGRLRAGELSRHYRLLLGVDAVQLGCNGSTATTLEILSDRFSVELATREVKLLRELFGSGEDRIGQRDGDFHGADSITAV